MSVVGSDGEQPDKQSCVAPNGGDLVEACRTGVDHGRQTNRDSVDLGLSADDPKHLPFSGITRGAQPVRRNFVIICPGAVIFWSNHDVANQKDKEI